MGTREVLTQLSSLLGWARSSEIENVPLGAGATTSRDIGRRARGRIGAGRLEVELAVELLPDSGLPVGLLDVDLVVVAGLLDFRLLLLAGLLLLLEPHLLLHLLLIGNSLIRRR